jgi:hypothetical protein
VETPLSIRSAKTRDFCAEPGLFLTWGSTDRRGVYANPPASPRAVCQPKQYKLTATLTHAVARKRGALMCPSPNLYQGTAAASAAVEGDGVVSYNPNTDGCCYCIHRQLYFNCSKCNARNIIVGNTFFLVFSQWQANYRDTVLSSHCHAPCTVVGGMPCTEEVTEEEAVEEATDTTEEATEAETEQVQQRGHSIHTTRQTWIRWCLGEEEGGRGRDAGEVTRQEEQMPFFWG